MVFILIHILSHNGRWKAFSPLENYIWKDWTLQAVLSRSQPTLRITRTLNRLVKEWDRKRLYY